MSFTIKIIFFSLSILADFCFASPTINTRILGGKDAKPGETPYHVSLQYYSGSIEKSQHVCGGTILNEYWILTAYHCLGFGLINRGSLVKAGRNNITAGHEEGEQIAFVDAIFKHEFYRKTIEGSMYDIGLIKLKTPLNLNLPRIAKAQLPEAYSEPSGSVLISGWGSTTENVNDPIFPDVLQTVVLAIIDRDMCQKALDDLSKEISKRSLRPVNYPLFATCICSGPLTGGLHPCIGDSGGALVSYNDKNEPVVVGIASYVIGKCGRPGAPAIYTKVSVCVEWINSIIAKN